MKQQAEQMKVNTSQAQTTVESLMKEKRDLLELVMLRDGMIEVTLTAYLLSYC